MRYVWRGEGKEITFPNKKKYDEHLRGLREGGMIRERSRKARPGVSKKTRPLSWKKAPPPYKPPRYKREKMEAPPGHVEQLISLVHPTRGRHNQAWACMTMWWDLCSSYNTIEHILSIDRDDTGTYLPLIQRLAGTINLKVVISRNDTMVQALNRGAEVATGDILIFLSDDFECPHNWDLKIQEAVEDHGDDWVLFVRDGIQKRTQTISILSRKYYKRFGYIYYPGYISMWADPDFTQTAIRLKKNVDGTHLLFQHNHVTVGRSPHDETYARQNSNKAWVHGEKLYQQRKENNFGVAQ